MNEEFAEFILNMRVATGMSTCDLAHRLCLPFSTLESYERGEKMPTNAAQFEICLRELVKAEIRKQRNYKGMCYTAVL